MNLKSSVKELKGIGEKTSVPLQKQEFLILKTSCGIIPGPMRLMSLPVEVDEMEDCGKYAVHAWVQSVSPVKRFKHYQIFSAQLQVGEAAVQATWFNMPFLRNYFQKGGQYIFRGTVAVRNGQCRMQQPEHYTLSDYDRLLHVMQPKYPLTTGLTEKMVMKAVGRCWKAVRWQLTEYLPKEIVESYGLESEWDAVRQIHFPKNEEVMRRARNRIVFDEFLLFVLGVRRLKEHQEQLSVRSLWWRCRETSRLMESLPYDLTGAQKRVWREIVADMTGKKVMSRLVQGDVGSG